MVKGSTKVKFEEIEVGVVQNHRRDLGDIGELAESIKSIGLLQPLVVLYKHAGGRGFVRPTDGKTVFSRYILVSGHRRYAAMEKLRKENAPDGDGASLFDEVPVVLFQGNEVNAKIAQLDENIKRKDLNYVEQADSFVDLVNCGLSQAEIGRRIHKTTRWVSLLVTIRTKCCDQVLRALARGDIPLEVAVDISGIEGPAAQVAELEQYLGTKKAKGKGEAKRQVKKDTGKKTRGSLKKAEQLIPLVITKIRKDGANDVNKARWRGAQQIVDYLTGTNDGDGIIEEAEKILNVTQDEDGEE